MQALVSVFAYIYQAGKRLNLCCHGNPDKYEIWLKITNFTPVFCGCDPSGKAHFLRSTHFLCCIKLTEVLASITWNLTLLAPLKLKLLAYEYQQVIVTSKIGHFVDPLEKRELYKMVKICKMSKIDPNCHFWAKISKIVRNDAFSPKSGYLT